jgi:outer membrane receptor protein involved in Fe transport
VAGFWRHDSRVWRILAGADLQHVEGTSTDRLFPAGIRTGGGSQTQQGTFAQLNVGSSAFRWLAGARYHIAGEDSRFFMPSTGFTAGRGWWRFRGTVYRSFRAPTLNELFRDFRVGNAETRANPDLQPESMFGAEAGADFYGESGRLSFSVFRHELDDLITNVTLSSGPTGIVRQRRNAAAALARGVDVNAEYRWHLWRLDLGYLFTDSRFSDGMRIPQVPKHSGNAQLTFFREGTLISGGLRSYAYQFEDDLNQFLLPGFATLGISARQTLYRSLSATFELENAADREYVVGFSPVPLIGSPRLIRVGLRWDGSIRR